MAKGKVRKAEGWAGAIPERVTELRGKMEKRVREGFDRAADLLPAPQRKALQRVTTNLDRFRHDLRKRGDKVVTTMRKRVEAARADMEKRVEEVLGPITKRFDVASRADVDRLRKRLEQLERRLGHKAEAA